MNRSLSQTANRINAWLLPLLAFSLPVSTSAVSVLASLIVFFWLLEGDFKRKWGEIIGNKVSLAVLIYLGLYMVGLLWSEDRGTSMEMFGKQWKILMMPIFLTAMPVADEPRRRVINFFLAGLLVMMVATYLAWFGIVHYGGVTPDHPTRNLFHVVYNPLLAFGFYLVMHDLLWGKRTAFWQAWLMFLAPAMALNMFITEGRAGQAAFFLLLAILLLQYFKKNITWGITFAVILLPLLFTAGYKLSPTFHKRVAMGWEEVAQSNTNPNTSVGLRIHFWKISWEIIKQNPWVGVGTCDFKSAYAEMNRILSPQLVATDNPHNQYFLVLCQLGLLGFVSLLGIFLMEIRQAFTGEHAWKNIRLAFPLFFLLIMLSESYLIVYETGFLFSLISAVLYKNVGNSKRGRKKKISERCWLILSYRSNLDGSACAQHIDDRLPFFLERGIVPVLLSGPIGKRSNRWPHFRSWSLAPSGIRFELRHYLRKRFHKRWQFKLVETILLLPVLPFYLLEKIFINFESEWSWFFVSSIRGYFLCRRFKPEVVYSTGGTASAHIAGGIISRLAGLPWLAETQDPLMHDYEWRRGRRVRAVYKWLEKRICTNADVFIFLAHAARENMAARAGMPGCGRVIYPGANPAMFQSGLYEKGESCHFAHFGTLNGTRNLIVFLKALRLLIDRDKLDQGIVKVDVYGSLDEGSKKAIKEFELEDVVTDHGAVTRKEALAAMQKTDCLLLIQNTIFFSSETIPSKVYEYMISGRPILGLLHHNHELKSMLQTSGNFPVPADQEEEVADAVENIIALFRKNSLSEWTACQDWTVSQAVDQLIRLGEEATRRIR